MSVLAIDPGPERSAYCELCSPRLIAPPVTAILPNESLRLAIPVLRFVPQDILVLEMVESYGMPVGRDVFETVYWIGRFAERAYQAGMEVVRLSRRAVKLALCHDSRANDATIRQALIDLYGPGREKAIGLKRTPGPLYGVKADGWAALAVACAYELGAERYAIAQTRGAVVMQPTQA